MVWTVALVQLMNVLDFMIVMPLGDDFAKSLAIPQASVGYVAGAYTAAALVSGLAGAQILDRFDRKRVLVIAMIGLAFGTAAGGLATGLPSLIAARVLAGLFGGPATATSLAIVADVVPVERRGRAMALVMAGFSVASVLGIPAGMVLARHGGWRTPLFVIGALALAVTLFGAWALPTLRGHLERGGRARTPARELLARPEVTTGLVTAGLIMFSVFVIVPHIPAYLINNVGFPRDHYELLYLGGGAVSFLVLQLAGRWVDQVGALPVMIAGTVVNVLALGTGFLTHQPLLPVIVFFMLFMSSGSLRGVAQSTLASRIPAASERAQYMSLQSAVQHAASTLGAFASAALLATDPVTKQITPVWAIALVAIAAAIGAPFALAATERALARRGPLDAGRPAAPAIVAEP